MHIMNDSLTTYIINLPVQQERKTYISTVLQPYKWLNISFIEAVDGRIIPEDELKNYGFDTTQSFQRYGRKLNPGEIGCTLSHFKCYQKLIESKEEFVLILEDDITIINNIEVINLLVKQIDRRVPTILFLSGDYWYHNIKRINEKWHIASVFDAVGSYAYIINRKAAERILKYNVPITNVADNWSLYRKQGVTLKAAFPYLIDANIENFESTIQQAHWGEIRSRMSFCHRINSYYNGLIKRILLYRGHFVSKIRKDV